jgi:hypothetical protein
MPLTAHRLMLACVAASAALALQSPGLSASAPTDLPAAADEAARRFLYAFSRNDRTAISGMLPVQLSNLYGESPFAETPKLLKARVKKRVAGVNFSGPMVDPALPRTGIIVLRRVEENGRRAWRVRQIYWYEELPRGAKLPEKSPTRADRAQEPEVLKAAEDFLNAWRAEDYERMDELTFHWWKVERDPPKWVKMTGVSFETRPTTLNGLRVDFEAKLKIARILTKRVEGNLWLVEEEGRWCVRPLTFSFEF